MALAITCCTNGHTVRIWSPFEEEVRQLGSRRTNEKLLSGIVLPEPLEVTGDIGACCGSDIVIIATPSFAVRQTAARLREAKAGGIVVNVAKGFEESTRSRLSVAVGEELPEHRVVALSGPCHAEEVARKIPTMVVAAGPCHEANQAVQKALSNDYFRVYTNDDIIGVELGGALKNVIAVAAGICDGMGLGDNSKAALITRGLVEMTRLGVKLGAKESTFSGLTGLGDLVVTCTSVHSRNHRFGEMVGRGVDIDTALKTVGTVEGYFATRTAYTLARENDVSMPITELCYALIYENCPLKDLVTGLMTRPFKAE